MAANKDPQNAPIEYDFLVQVIKLEHIIPSPNYFRSELVDEEIKELTADIKKNTLLQAIIVFPIKDSNPRTYEIVAGHRRYEAVKLLGGKTISARIVGDRKQAKLIQLSENLQRKNLSPLEIANALAHIKVEQGDLTHEEIAKVVNKSSSWVGRYMLLAEAPDDVKEFVKDHPTLFTKVVESGIASYENIDDRQKKLNQLLENVPVAKKPKKPGRPPKTYTHKSVKNGFNFNIQYRTTLELKEKQDTLKKLKELVDIIEDELKTEL